ncbi:MAG: NAD(P)/FAD-dependent oxidoreductase [Anaerolineaceae bacterium]|nr:NAD(P)/FAD-dependent oxidoreductase [Anaerolineaceae bacterium]
MTQKRYDAVIVGSGPNGLAAAITLARGGRSVLVLEGKETPGGGVRSLPLTLPGYRHDVCAAVFPLGMASPFFRGLPFQDYGLHWVHPGVPLAHPLDDGTAVLLERSVVHTARTLGRDGQAYQALMLPWMAHWQALVSELLSSLRPPRRLDLLARFGLRGVLPASLLIRTHFRGERARALMAGLSAHAMLPLEQPGTAAFGILLGLLGHAVGWPVAQGGSQRIITAMLACLEEMGGEILTGRMVTALADLPPARAVLFDLTPHQLVRIQDVDFPGAYRRSLQNYRYGVGVFKMDFALDAPVPWKAAACSRAGTLHLGGTWEEIAQAEQAVWQGHLPRRPFVLLAQPSLFDPQRAPQGRHTLWAYCHTPAGSVADMSDLIEEQIERFAPGFRSRILARHTFNAREMEGYNPNYVGGDINAGVQDLGQHFARPALRWDPYSTPDPRVYLCSSSTPPGGGVHGMCGYHAARSALRRLETDGRGR